APSRPLRKTVAPAPASALAISKPRPRPAPVTRAILPVRSNQESVGSIARACGRCGILAIAPRSRPVAPRQGHDNLAAAQLARLPDVDGNTPERILDRLNALYPKAIDLTLDRVLRLLGELGAPQE